MCTQASPVAAFTIGAAVYNPNGQTGYISRLIPIEGGNRQFMIGATMEAITQDVEICFPDHLSQLGEPLVRPWLQRAAAMGIAPITAEEVEGRRAAAVAAKEEARRWLRMEQDTRAEAAAAFRLVAAEKMPVGAKAVIVAELMEDKSDSMTDYFNSVTTRTVILGFSAHTRDLFPELRKAALNFAETATLFDAPDSAEHREKYSMGGGFYLKAGYRHSNGWKVSKQRLYQGADSVPVGEWSLTPPATAGAPVVAAGGIEKHTHSKKGFDMWIVTMGERVEREEYDRLLAAAKILGGWYSRKWGKTPAGFAFKTEADAEAFAGGQPSTTPDASTPAPKVASNAGTAEKMRGLADKLQGDIEARRSDRRTNTPKQQREAQSARMEADRLERTQKALRALADHHDAGTVPAELRGVTTKTAVYDLMRGEIKSSGGYYDAGYETGRPSLNTPAALTLWAMIDGPSAEQRAADDVRRKVEALKFANIPGYFPTPAALVAQMIEAADIDDGAGVDVLEPEAGSGAICDIVRDRFPLARISAIERHHSLREILVAKGHNVVSGDFLETSPRADFDRVLMNPPFENGQDMQHVRHAWDFLRAGGRLVAIMSPGPFYRQDRKAADFRAWFCEMGGERVDIEAGAFKESGTGVATVLVVIDR